ncbi:MAG TPA: NADH-quinone oxidoreductase subunit L [Myxococcaceae bacterium]|jgi:NAD(P)H-quinone oxidoreductase subunit 5
MNDPFLGWTAHLGLAALAIPLTYSLAAVFVARAKPFRLAGPAAALSLGLALLVASGWGLVAQGQPLSPVLPLGGTGSPALSLRLDGVTITVLALVCFIAFIIVRFSRAYLHGDAGQARYVRWLMLTLAAVTTLVISNHLLVLALAWVGTSLALHQLLTFYAQRPQALIVAHKKFLVSRVADVCLLSAIWLIHANVGSLRIDEVNAWAEATGSLPAGMELAAVLIVIGASLKCAQLPFHGWLIQVMEAPTPVSALLHAGVVNIGGFLMLRLAPLMVKAEPAQTLLVLIGSVTAVVAALVMTTRVSIKVMLAWSTCAQMGFMLVQCALGAYSLALLHLVGHSLYKAHAFLSSGSTVESWRAQTLVPRAERAGLGHWLAAAVAACAGVAGVATVYGASPRQEPALWALALILSLALTQLLVRGVHRGWRLLVQLTLGGAGVAALYFTWHALAGQFLQVPASTGALTLRVGIVAVCFAVLCVLQALLQSRPEGRLARALYPRLFAGLYLDEFFTRLTFRIWPPRLPPRAPHNRPPLTVGTLEA